MEEEKREVKRGMVEEILKEKEEEKRVWRRGKLRMDGGREEEKEGCEI